MSFFTLSYLFLQLKEFTQTQQFGIGASKRKVQYLMHLILISQSYIPLQAITTQKFWFYSPICLTEVDSKGGKKHIVHRITVQLPPS